MVGVPPASRPKDRSRSVRGRGLLLCPYDMTAHRDLAERTEKREVAELTENTERNDPIDPIDRHDPTDPIESTDPFEAIDRNEFSDAHDQREDLELLIAGATWTNVRFSYGPSPCIEGHAVAAAGPRAERATCSGYQC